MSRSCFASFPVCVYIYIYIFSSHYLNNIIFYRQEFGASSDRLTLYICMYVCVYIYIYTYIYIYIYTYSLTQLSTKLLLKCTFNYVSQFHVSARPSGAIFRLNIFKSQYVQLTLPVDYEISYDILKILSVQIQHSTAITTSGHFIPPHTTAVLTLLFIHRRYSIRLFSSLKKKQISYKSCIKTSYISF